MNNYNDNIKDHKNYQANNSDVHSPETKVRYTHITKKKNCHVLNLILIMKSTTI